MPAFFVRFSLLCCTLAGCCFTAAAQSYLPPAFLYGYRVGRLANQQLPPPIDSEPQEELMAQCSDGQGGAYVSLFVRVGASLPGLPIDNSRPGGIYLLHIAHDGRMLWHQVLVATPRFSDYGKLWWGITLQHDGHGGVVLTASTSDSARYDGQFLFGNHPITYQGQQYRGWIPSIIRFDSTGTCRWVRQIGSVSMDNSSFDTSPTTASGFWATCSYSNLDWTSIFTPFQLPPDSLGTALFHVRLPDGQVDRAYTFVEAPPSATNSNGYGSFRDLAVGSDGRLSMTGYVWGSRRLGQMTIRSFPNPSFFWASVDTVGRWEARLENWPPTSMGDFPKLTPITDMAGRRRYLIRSRDSIALEGVPVIRRQNSRAELAYMAERDSAGRWHNVHPILRFDSASGWANLPISFYFNQLADLSNPPDSLLYWARAQRIDEPCRPLGPDTVCSDTNQPYNQVIIVATNAQATRIKWAVADGGSTGMPFHGTVMGPMLLVTGGAAPNQPPLPEARFGTGATLQRSYQTNTLLAGLRLPQGQRPMSARQLEQVLSAPYPNPAPAGASLRWPGKAAPASLLNLQGQCLGTMTQDCQGLYRLPQGLAPGLYLLRRAGQTARLAVGG